MNSILYRLGNYCFRVYIQRKGKAGAANVLIRTLEWLRWYADDNKLDFRAAVASSRRRESSDFDSQSETVIDFIDAWRYCGFFS